MLVYGTFSRTILFKIVFRMIKFHTTAFTTALFSTYSNTVRISTFIYMLYIPVDFLASFFVISGKSYFTTCRVDRTT